MLKGLLPEGMLFPFESGLSVQPWVTMGILSMLWS